MKTTDCAPVACAEPWSADVEAIEASSPPSASSPLSAASPRRLVNELNRSAAPGLKWIAGGAAKGACCCCAWWSSAARHRYPALTAAATSTDSRTAFGVSTDNSLQAAPDGA